VLFPNMVPVEILTVNFVGWSAFLKTVLHRISTVNLRARVIVFAAAADAAAFIYVYYFNFQ